MMESTISTETVIIGAGLSGLILAVSLQQNARPIIVLEKSKGVGGRISTRRINNLGFDHGTPYWSDHYPVPASLTSLMRKDHKGIFIEGGMNQFAKFFSQTLPIQRETRVTRISKNADTWLLSTDSGHLYEAKNVVLTAPLPQARELLIQSGFAQEMIPEITYSKTVLSLNVLNELPSDTSQFNPSIFSFQNLRNLHPLGVIINPGDEFAEKYFEETDEEILKKIAAFSDQAGLPLNVKTSELKKWRYARPLSHLQESYLEVDENLFLIGDFFSPGQIDGALSSAEALSKHLTRAI